MENFNLIGNFTGKLFNNFAHAQAVSSRPIHVGRPCEGGYELSCSKLDMELTESLQAVYTEGSATDQNSVRDLRISMRFQDSSQDSKIPRFQEDSMSLYLEID